MRLQKLCNSTSVSILALYQADGIFAVFLPGIKTHFKIHQPAKNNFLLKSKLLPIIRNLFPAIALCH